MRGYERAELDYLPRVMNYPAFYDEDENTLLVNGMLGKYRLWVSKNDTSVTPCLTGEVGGMPGAWENWVTSWHTKNLDQFDTYIDIGANSGYFAFLAAYYDLNVIACEANPLYARLLELSRDENDLSVQVIEGAVSDFNGVIELSIPEELHGGASIVFDIGPKTEVWARTLDRIISNYNIHPGRTLIKIDVEGAEPLVFAGAVETNRDIRPTYIMEYTSRHYNDDFYDKLLEYGEVSMVDGNGNEQPVTKEFANSQDDWITLVVRPR